MSEKSLGIVSDGQRRLRGAVEAEIRGRYAKQASEATTAEQKRQVSEEQIQREINEEMKRVSSPYSLWSKSGFCSSGR